MKNINKIFKSLLATASAISVLSSGIENSLARGGTNDNVENMNIVSGDVNIGTLENNNSSSLSNTIIVNGTPAHGQLVVNETVIPSSSNSSALTVSGATGCSGTISTIPGTEANLSRSDANEIVINAPTSIANVQTISSLGNRNISIISDGSVAVGTTSISNTLTEGHISSSVASSDTLNQVALALSNLDTTQTQLSNIFDKPSDSVQLTVTNAVDSISRFSESVNTQVTDKINMTINTVVNNVRSRIGSLVTFVPSNGIEVSEASHIKGISAGDEMDIYGIWGSPVYATSIQKTYDNFSGYIAKTFGGTLGFDAKITEEAIIGAAISLINTKSKYKGFKSGDKTSMNSTLFSIYGMYQFTNELFVQGVATYANTKVKNSESRRVSNASFETAMGKYIAKSFNIEALIGYNQMLTKEFVVTPMIGLGYTNNQSNTYTESGTINQNMKISVKANQKLEGIAGLKLTTVAYNLNGFEVMSEVHGFIKQDLTNKAIKVNTQTVLDTSLNITSSSKNARTYGNIGLSLNAKQGIMEYGIGYDLNFAKRFVGNQGSLKIKVNF